MKKLISVFVGLAMASSVMAANVRTFSFIPPSVISIMLTNTIGITNLNHGTQMGGGLQLTNYATASANTMYSNNAPLIVSGTNLPGVLVIDVTTNITAAAGTMGVAPFSASNLTFVKTNDALNLFQDIMFPSDWSPAFGTIGGPNTTNLACNLSLEVTFLGSQLTGSGNGSNYVTAVFVPLTSDTNEMVITSLGGTAAGVLQSLQPISVNITNAASTTALCPVVIPIPTASFVGARGIRLESLTPGVAWSTGGSVWVTGLKLNMITQ